MITIGIDPHKRPLTAAALGPHSRLLGQLRVPTTSQAGGQLLAWAEQWPSGAGPWRAPAGWAAGSPSCWSPPGEQVVDVPAKLAARARLLGTSSARRDDLVAERTRTLPAARAAGRLQPGGAKQELSAARAAALLRQVKTASQAIGQAVREHGTT